MAIQTVEALIPGELIDAHSKSDDTERKSFFEKLKEKMADNKFDKMRVQMICEAFGIDEKYYEDLLNDYEKAISEKSPLKQDRIERLRSHRSIYKVQQGANNNDRKQVKRNVVKNGLKLVLITICGFTIPSTLTIPATVLGLFYSCWKYNKREGGNLADEHDKEERYYKDDLIPLINDFNKLNDEFIADREMIETAKSSMSKREFDSYLKEYLKSKVQNLEIESPIFKDPEIAKELEVPDGAINDKLENKKLLSSQEEKVL